MNDNKEDELFQQTKIEDYDEFCDSKHLSGNAQKQSTQNDTDTLQKKRERESDELEEDKKDVNNKNNNIFDKKDNDNLFIYSDDDCENDLKDNSSSSSYNEKEYFDFYDFKNIQGIEDTDEKYNAMMGELECNDEFYQMNNI